MTTKRKAKRSPKQKAATAKMIRANKSKDKLVSVTIKINPKTGHVTWPMNEEWLESILMQYSNPSDKWYVYYYPDNEGAWKRRNTTIDSIWDGDSIKGFYEVASGLTVAINHLKNFNPQTEVVEDPYLPQSMSNSHYGISPKGWYYLIPAPSNFNIASQKPMMGRYDRYMERGYVPGALSWYNPQTSRLETA